MATVRDFKSEASRLFEQLYPNTPYQVKCDSDGYDAGYAGAGNNQSFTLTAHLEDRNVWIHLIEQEDALSGQNNVSLDLSDLPARDEEAWMLLVERFFSISREEAYSWITWSWFQT